jgi:N-acetylglutamate synthase-like GNAT family acetyltransferase
MIRICKNSDFQAIYEIINDAAQAYKGIIPKECWNDPYMQYEELMEEIKDGVVFWGWEDNDQPIGLMGIQEKSDVTLIRHAYVLTRFQKRGIGTKLLHRLENITNKPILIGTWAAASWAISFYEKNGYTLTSEEEKYRLLKKYWSIPDRQVETSVVLASQTRNKGEYSATAKD